MGNKRYTRTMSAMAVTNQNVAKPRIFFRRCTGYLRYPCSYLQTPNSYLAITWAKSSRNGLAFVARHGGRQASIVARSWLTHLSWCQFILARLVFRKPSHWAVTKLLCLCDIQANLPLLFHVVVPNFSPRNYIPLFDKR